MNPTPTEVPPLSAEEQAEQNKRAVFDPRLAPEKIWLQISDEALDYIRPENIEWSEVTWCRQVVNVHDVEYVRADLISTEVVVNEQLAKWEEAFLACQEQYGVPLNTINKPLALTAAFCLLGLHNEDAEAEVFRLLATLAAANARADAAEQRNRELEEAGTVAERELRWILSSRRSTRGGLIEAAVHKLRAALRLSQLEWKVGKTWPQPIEPPQGEL